MSLRDLGRDQNGALSLRDREGWWFGLSTLRWRVAARKGSDLAQKRARLAEGEADELLAQIPVEDDARTQRRQMKAALRMLQVDACRR